MGKPLVWFAIIGGVPGYGISFEHAQVSALLTALRTHYVSLRGGARIQEARA